MKILFICGSLEPGRDGVGDYVRMLGEELSRDTGVQVSAMAIHDPWVSAETCGDQNAGFPVLRIPAALTPGRRLETALEYIGRFGPDWISVQYVPYSFHPRGLPLFLGRHLAGLTRNTRVHVMVHETWAGTGREIRPQRILASGLQKILFRNLLDRLRPAVLHTHLPEYRQKLERLHHRALELPLFSNIRVAACRQTEPDRFIIGFFSQMACSPEILKFLDTLARKAVLAGIPAEVLLIGGRQCGTEEFFRFIRTMPYYRNRVTCTGFLSPKETSAAIRSCSVGITPVPRHALGKSGSVAAFLSHGIPVAAPHAFENRHGVPGFFSAALQATILTEPDLDQLESARSALITARDEIRVREISLKFLKDLNQYSDI